ncbi:MAG: hypothetical protein IKS20_08000 [Victivallales bacterium]|nr:hypothetical protein [Victivallales bacterium]
MARHAFAVVLVALLGLLAADDTLLFHLNFDSYFTVADVAGGKAESVNFERDLQLRMCPGIDGKGNALKLNGREFCAYKMKGNFDTRRGTVNLWCSPQNWSLAEKTQNVFFEAKQADFRLLLYKFVNTPYICVYFQTRNFEVVNAKINTADWGNGQWHMLTATWDNERLRVYVDGKMPPSHRPGNMQPAIPEKVFNPEKTLPDVSEHGVIGLGNLFQGFSGCKETEETSFNELSIYKRVLSPVEIENLYEKIRPPRRDASRPVVLTVPKCKSVPILDGDVTDDEWRDSAHIPLKVVYKGANHTLQSSTKVRLKTVGESLYIGFTTDQPLTKRQFTRLDEKVYNDDSLEIFFRDDEKHEYWFNINANGAILDARDDKVEWNSGAKAAGRPLEKGWSAEVAIPLASIGSPVPGRQYRANMHALNFSNAPNYYLSWSGSPETRASSGSNLLMFAENEECVSVEKLGDIYGGNLAARIKAAVPVSVKVNGENVASLDGLYLRRLNAGKHQLEISAGEKFYYPLEFIVDKPLALSTKAYPSREKLVVRANLSSAGGDFLDGLGSSTGEAWLERNGKVLAKAGFKPGIVTDVELPLKPTYPSGEYQIKAKVKGKKILNASMNFRIPDQAPYKAKVALDHTVPEPWVEIQERNAGSFEILDRRYEFNESPFPKSMVSRGRNVLASQPVLYIDGRPAKWGKSNIVQRNGDVFLFSGEGNCRGIRIPWKGELWFDGMWKIDFTLQPGEACKIGNMHIEWRMPEESAKCFISNWKSGYVTVPWENHQIKTDLTVKDSCWLTGIETGMAWMPLSSANWVAGKSKATVLQQESGAVSVTLNIIGKEVLLEKPATYSMAFIATPSKRPVKNFRTIAEGGYLNNPYENMQISSTGSMLDRADRIDGYSHKMKFPGRYRKEYIEPYLKRGVRLFPYHQPKSISQLDAEWDYYLEEWKSVPGYVQSGLLVDKWQKIDCVHCCGEGIADLCCYNLAQLYKDFPELGGIYYDICNVGQCNNTNHGHGGTDAFGQKYYDSTVLSLREYLMRVYKISHGMGKAVFNHAHNYFTPFAHNFTDYWYPGENEVWLYGENPDYYYCEAPLLEYQYAWSPVIRGAAIIRCNQVSRVLFMEKLKPRKKELEGEKMAERSFASAWLHDFTVDSDWINNRAVAKFWKIRNKLNLDEATFHGYWFDSNVISKSAGVYVSWYELKNAPYGKVLMVCNMSRKNQPVSLQTEMLKEGDEITELWSGKKYSARQANELVVPENGFLLLAF